MAVTRDLINDAYNQILQRDADERGLVLAIEAIEGGHITIDKLIDNLRNSDEYKHKNVYKQLAQSDYKQRVITRLKNIIFSCPNRLW